MKIEVVPVLNDNFAYLVICEATGKAATVDPGAAAPVLEQVRRLGVELTDLWNTHHHFDHIGGNDEIKAQAGVRRHMGHASDRGRIPGLTHKLAHDQRFSLGELEVQALHTPGHTLGAVCYRVQDCLFTGDTLFGAGCGRLFEGDPPTMFNSLRSVIATLPGETRLFFGHEYTLNNLDFAATLEPGNQRLQQRIERVRQQMEQGEPSVPSTLDEELATNPFLRWDSEELRQSLAGKFPDDELDDLQVFTRLRELRNRW